MPIKLEPFDEDDYAKRPIFVYASLVILALFIWAGIDFSLYILGAEWASALDYLRSFGIAFLLIISFFGLVFRMKFSRWLTILFFVYYLVAPFFIGTPNGDIEMITFMAIWIACIYTSFQLLFSDRNAYYFSKR